MDSQQIDELIFLQRVSRIRGIQIEIRGRREFSAQLVKACEQSPICAATTLIWMSANKLRKL